MAGPNSGQQGAPAEASRKAVSSNNLLLRIVSSVILAAIALTLAWHGGPLFVLFWTVAALAVWWEWLRLIHSDAPSGCLAIGLAAIAVAAGLIVTGHDLVAIGVLALGAVASAGLAARRGGWTAAGLVYAGILVIAPAMLRGEDIDGRIAIFFLFAVVWATDIVAYFVGRAVGGPKLAPAISPNKTWSGAIGGTAGAVAAALGVLAVADVSATIGIVLVIAALSIVSQAGDLFESRLKRAFHVKDSSALIPGHGGVMDRVDGFVFASGAALLLGAARGGWAMPAQGLIGW